VSAKKIILSGFAGSLVGGSVIAVLFQNSLTQKVLFDPTVQSAKLIDAWAGAFLPEPLFVIGLIILSLIYGLMYHYSHENLPGKDWKKGAYFGLLFIFAGHWIFHEYITAFNLFGEPLHLLTLELVFLALGSIVQGVVIQKVYDYL